MEDFDEDLKVIKVNGTLNNSENKIQAKFCEVLGLRSEGGKITSVEMEQKVVEFFQQNEALSVLFIFEDIEYYVESTKQLMLYKILDLLSRC